jgi:CRP/FNR family transcriptional regulator, cyclic AMP receptor protein
VVSAAESSDVLSSTIRRGGHIRRFQRGQALFTEGDLAERVFLIERGWVTVTCTTSAGREIMLALRGPGEMLGELSALDGEPRLATAIAVSEVEAMVVSGSTLTKALDDVQAARELIRMLAARLRDSDRKRLEFAALDTLGRVAWRLLELGDGFGEETNEGISVDLPLSQEQLAGWCGASRESTVKALTSLRELGSITTGRRHVVIRDPDALRRHARGII